MHGSQRIFYFGDTLSARIGGILEQFVWQFNVNMHLSCIPGRFYHNIEDEITKKEDVRQNDVIVIQGGKHDAKLMPLDTILSDVAACVACALQYCKCVIVVGVPPINPRSSDKILGLNSELKNIAKADNVEYVDTFDIMFSDGELFKPNLARTGINLSAQGRAKFAQCVLATLAWAIGSASPVYVCYSCSEIGHTRKSCRSLAERRKLREQEIEDSKKEQEIKKEPPRVNLRGRGIMARVKSRGKY